MWTCPKCKHKFFNTNQSHSCGHYTVDDFLEGKSAGAIALFNYFITQYRKIGRFELHPVKTRVALLTQMRFCSINRVADEFIDVHFVLTREYGDSSSFFKIDNLANRFYVHHLRIQSKSDITAEVRKYMRLAYEVGNRKHVEKKRRVKKE